MLLLLSRFSRVQLCDPIDGSPPGSAVPGILQARILEWVAISFSNAWKWKVKVKLLSCVNSLWPHGLQPTRLLHPWDFPGKSTGVGCHCLVRNKEQKSILKSKEEGSEKLSTSVVHSLFGSRDRSCMWKTIFPQTGQGVGAVITSQMTLGWFKHITFIMHFISIFITAAPPQIISIRSQRLGTPELPDGFTGACLVRLNCLFLVRINCLIACFYPTIKCWFICL